MLELSKIKKSLRALGFKGEVSINQDVLKRAYKGLSKKVHPDVEGGSHDAFKQVQDAYEYLLEFGLGLTVDLTEHKVLVKQGDDLLTYLLAGREYRYRI
jgi:dnaJ-like protein